MAWAPPRAEAMTSTATRTMLLRVPQPSGYCRHCQHKSATYTTPGGAADNALASDGPRGAGRLENAPLPQKNRTSDA